MIFQYFSRKQIQVLFKPVQTLSLYAGSFLHAFFLSHADFSKLTFSKNYFKNAIRLSNSFDPDQAQQTVCKGCQQMTLAGINLDSACPAVQRE